MLDGDTAGYRAMMRAAEVALPLLKPGFSLRFAILPRGEDPDTYIQQNGKTAFEKILASSRRLSQVLWDTMAPQYKVELPEGRAALEAALKQLAEKIQDPTVRSHYASYFKKLLWQQPQKTPTKDSKGKPLPNASRSAAVEQMVVQHQSAALDTLVQRLLNVVLKYPSFLQKSHVEEAISRCEIKNPRLEALRNALLSSTPHLEDEAAFVASVERCLSGIPLETLRLGYLENVSHDDATYLWGETISMYELVYLSSEAKALEDSLALSMNEDTLHRLVEVKDALHRAQSRMTFAPAETDIV
ncbi:MAG: hypothetical protein K2Q01_01030 [Rickettsiales bacterium]|nr:hypothetical protein [Rickettsiales bacterium]